MKSIFSSISGGLEFWLANDTSIYENSESKVFKNIIFLGGISNNWPKYLLVTNVYIRPLNFVDNYY